MEIVFAGFILGLIGSLHCAGMCGPIALNLPLRGNTIVERLISGILYNLGRTLMYGIMGAVFGSVGKGLFLLGIQQWVSIIMGTVMILTVITPFIFKKFNYFKFDFFTKYLSAAIQKLFKIRSYKGLFFIGMLNSLLPCGLVYVAIIGAIATGNIYYGSLYLILFGLGTLPMMLSISLVGNFITFRVRNRLNRLIPYLVVFIGALFIMRGLCLGIPYISPYEENLENTINPKQTEVTQDTIQNTGSCCHPK